MQNIEEKNEICSECGFEQLNDGRNNHSPACFLYVRNEYKLPEPNQEWEKKFDKKFPAITVVNINSLNIIKQFISDLIKQRDEKWMKCVPGEYKREPLDEGQYEEGYEAGHYICRSKFLKNAKDSGLI